MAKTPLFSQIEKIGKIRAFSLKNKINILDARYKLDESMAHKRMHLANGLNRRDTLKAMGIFALAPLANACSGVEISKQSDKKVAVVGAPLSALHPTKPRRKMFGLIL